MTPSGLAHKSPEAFRTISEVAAELDVPQHVLRFWETKFTPVKPLKRGGGRRYYRPDDLDLLRGIATLLYGDGLTIKGVQKILREQGPRYVIDLGRGKHRLVASPQSVIAALSEEAARFGAEVKSGSVSSPDLSNVHHFARGRETRAGLKDVDLQEAGLTGAERTRFSTLLDELLELKLRLKNARQRHRPAS